ncbi:hypothetical protein FRX31_008798 [Thalictrum thalictroides]|uniref:Uncharacterized protein n=1 Tax=Thalictrum thalictroides TaxID=46969 RepID=A0A7J6WYG9_THATH|nr:hypothetical protein FRX31_008798 [Thalictrum thalictroides]
MLGNSLRRSRLSPPPPAANEPIAPIISTRFQERSMKKSDRLTTPPSAANPPVPITRFWERWT